jgi:hypothetical protein
LPRRSAAYRVEALPPPTEAPNQISSPVGDRSLADRDRPAFQALGKILAGDELHGEEVSGRPVGERRALEAVDVGDAGVVEGGEDLRLALEAGQPIGIGGEGLGKQLEGDVAAELRVRGPVDVAHPARAEGRPDQVGSEAGLGRKRHSSCG